jgi:exodeoxyribonuclease-1
MTTKTLLWYDYETWGIDPAFDRPAQFAAIRTDLDLNIIGEPIEIYCKLATDYLPNPEAAFVTGLTPQKVNRLGVAEIDFIRKVNEVMSEPGTCVVGYNSLRFDDEVTRHCLYRNLMDPYSREWQNGNSRWDLIDLVRACFALRPEGIEWPHTEEGKPSLKLEALTAANGIGHASAHDAVSDVEATIELARCIRKAQPKLYDYYFKLRDKNQVMQTINLDEITPLVHVSGMFGHARHCTSLIAPIAKHPQNKNALIAVDLARDLSPLFELDPETLLTRLYTKKDDLGDALPVPLKLVHINKCPMLGPISLMQPHVVERLDFDMDFAKQQLARLRAHPEVIENAVAMYALPRPALSERPHTDAQLYSGGFFSPNDKAQMLKVHQTEPQNLMAKDFQFEDPRLDQMLFLLRGRNYPHTLDADEHKKWKDYCQMHLQVTEYLYTLENLVYEYEQDQNKLGILRQLFEYVQHI